MVGVEGIGWQRSTLSGGNPEHPLGMVPVMLVVEAVEVLVPATTSRTFQVFLKVFSNMAKGVFLQRRSPKVNSGWREPSSSFCRDQKCSKGSSRTMKLFAGVAPDLGILLRGILA